jgi:hypothetical protein
MPYADNALISCLLFDFWQIAFAFIAVLQRRFG